MAGRYHSGDLRNQPSFVMANDIAPAIKGLGTALYYKICWPAFQSNLRERWPNYRR
jgi:hypothetical protein